MEGGAAYLEGSVVSMVDGRLLGGVIQGQRPFGMGAARLPSPGVAPMRQWCPWQAVRGVEADSTRCRGHEIA